MLCQFTFKNFRSYRDAATLDMRAANLEEFGNTLIKSGDPKFPPLLPIAAIYGPNAGGKSNAIEALAYLVFRVLRPIVNSMGWDAIGRNPSAKFGLGYDEHFQPFLFDGYSQNEPMEFEIFFRTNSAQYHYQLSVLRERIVSESLFFVKYPCECVRYARLFERDGEKIALGAALKKAAAQTGSVSPSVSFLSFLSIGYQFPEIQDVMRWFGNCCFVSFLMPNRDHKFYAALNLPEVKGNVLELLSAMDIPISDYNFDESRKDSPIYTTHSVNGERYQLSLRDESEGTQKVFSILFPIFVTLAQGGIFIVDELDAKLHPQLLRYLVSLYANPESNDERAQLIFTCHDLSVMSNELLRRDEIWFAARGEDSGSELWSLSDIQDENGKRVPNTEAYDKQYLTGRYGADPYLRRIREWGVSYGKEA